MPQLTLITRLNYSHDGAASSAPHGRDIGFKKGVYELLIALSLRSGADLTSIKTGEV